MPKRVVSKKQFDKQLSLFDDTGNPIKFHDDKHRSKLESDLRMWGAAIRTKHNKEDWEGAAKHYEPYIRTHNELYPDSPISMADMNQI